MIAAHVNTKALSTYMGHSSITITLDRYGHLLPGNETEAAQLLEMGVPVCMISARAMPTSNAASRYDRAQRSERSLIRLTQVPASGRP
jgi:hypothetical protein